MRRILFYCILLIPFTLRAQPRWHVETASITFEIKNAGFPVRGSFEGLEADIRFDPARPGRSTIVASIDASSVRTGIGLRDQHLRGRDYFDVQHHPQIHMDCVRIEKTESDAFTGLFRLQIKEVVQSVTVPFTFAPRGRRGRLEGHFALNRLDFGLGGPSPILADDVLVRLEVGVAQAE